MAAGAVVLDSSTPRQVGAVWEISGTVEVDSTLRAFDIAGPKAYLLSLVLLNSTGLGTAKVILNQHASGNTQNGSAAIQSNSQTPVIGDPPSTELYRFVAHFV